MGALIAIDPGRTTGWALFLFGELESAGWKTDQEMLLEPIHSASYADVVLEVPRIYPRKGKGDQNDLIDLAVLVGDLRGYYRRRGGNVLLVPPRKWKGTVPKGIHNERVLDALKSHEKKRLPRRPRAKEYDHNMVDAVGLGLWKLGRLC